MKLSFFIILGIVSFLTTSAWAQLSRSAEQAIDSGLQFNQTPVNFEIPKFGEIDFHAIATGIGIAQSNPVHGDYNSIVDVSNAQIIVKKDSGLIQLYVQSGLYSTPSLGTSYQRASKQTKDSFGLVPLASISIAPSQNWLISGGKINSFGGYEHTFTYQNINIDRGLLWNQTSNVSRGFEVAYKDGAVSTAITLNDGFYSNQLNWMGASWNYQLDSESSAGIVWTGALKASSTNTFITPILQNNSQIFNAIYTYQTNHWSITPYLQYTYIPANSTLGILSSAQTAGAAVLTNYHFNGDSLKGFSLPLRFEYISSSGKGTANSPNLLYGPGSSALSVTITPTYQIQSFFVRGELSYVQALNTTAGLAFGNSGTVNNQLRVMLETGILY